MSGVKSPYGGVSFVLAREKGRDHPPETFGVRGGGPAWLRLAWLRLAWLRLAWTGLALFGSVHGMLPEFRMGQNSDESVTFSKDISVVVFSW